MKLFNCLDRQPFPTTITGQLLFIKPNIVTLNGTIQALINTSLYTACARVQCTFIIKLQIVGIHIFPGYPNGVSYRCNHLDETA